MTEQTQSQSSLSSNQEQNKVENNTKPQEQSTVKVRIGGLRNTSEQNTDKIILEPEDIESITKEGSDRPIIVTKKYYSPTEVKILEPRLVNADGTENKPLPFDPRNLESTVGYKTKLKIAFADTEYICLIPNAKWFINYREENGEKFKDLDVSFRIDRNEKDLQNSYVSELEKLYIRYCLQNGHEIGDIEKSDFIDDLMNYEYRLTQYYDAKGEPKRLDIYDFRRKETQEEVEDVLEE